MKKGLVVPKALGAVGLLAVTYAPRLKPAGEASGDGVARAPYVPIGEMRTERMCRGDELLMQARAAFDQARKLIELGARKDVVEAEMRIWRTIRERANRVAGGAA